MSEGLLCLHRFFCTGIAWGCETGLGVILEYTALEFGNGKMELHDEMTTMNGRLRDQEIRDR